MAEGRPGGCGIADMAYYPWISPERHGQDIDEASRKILFGQDRTTVK